MSDVVISAENVGKEYLIFHEGEPGQGFRHVLNDWISRPAKWLAGKQNGAARVNGVESPQRKGDSKEPFWALREVSFQIQRGAVVGIIGRNGAGKSTLLKILSRITEPTTGRIHMKGRVASLLEVGTGFHPELTGRENIFLNGAILGMGRGEIRNKFDEIVAFAEVEKFLDTPVKRYSSGMYVRLAFAVAAHLEPEILIVDEVLAVGDAQFQKKCLGRMQEVAHRNGRTVIFVSHNMAAVSSLCEQVILLERGRMVSFEDTDAGISRYTAANGSGSYIRGFSGPSGARSTIRAAWIEVDGERSTSNQPVPLTTGCLFDLVIDLVTARGGQVEIVASFFDHLRRPLWAFSNTSFEQPLLSGDKHFRVRLSYRLPAVTTPQMTIDLGVGIPGVYPYQDLITDAITCPITRETMEHHRKINLDFPMLLEPGCDIVSQTETAAILSAV